MEKDKQILNIEDIQKEEFSCEKDDLDLLRGILEVLENCNPEDTISLFNDILGLNKDFMFYENCIEQILCYYEAKIGFPYPQVM